MDGATLIALLSCFILASERTLVISGPIKGGVKCRSGGQLAASVFELLFLTLLIEGIG